MKQIYLFLTSLFLWACSQPDDVSVVTNIDFEAKTASLFSTEVLEPAEYLPLENQPGALVEPNSKLTITEDGYFIFNRGVLNILRFDLSGKFLNKISAKGNGPGEYTDIQDFLINPTEKTLEVLSISNQKIFKYNYTGSFLSEISVPGRPFSFAKLNNGDYVLAKGVYPDSELGTAPVYQVSSTGILQAQHLAVTNTALTSPSFEESIQVSNGNIYFKSWLNGNIYRLSDTTCSLVTQVDFKGKKLPENILELSQDAFFDILIQGDFMTIDRYLENKNYIYLFITAGNGESSHHILYNKNKKTSFIADSQSPQKGWNRLQAAKILTSENELIFMTDPGTLSELMSIQRDVFVSAKNAIMLNEDANNILIKLKIK